MILKPVGLIRSKTKEPGLIADEDGLQLGMQAENAMEEFRNSANQVSRIEIDKKRIGLLDGVESYSHLIVLYWAHETPERARFLNKVHPMGKQDIPETGIFSTCSPARPNPVMMTTVSFLRKWENVLEVKGLDAIDGSPVVDIKPYVPSLFPMGDIRIPEWMKSLNEEYENGTSHKADID